MFNLYGTTVGSRARLQSIVALSTTKAELVAAVKEANEARYLKHLISNEGLVQDMVVYLNPI